MMNKRVNKHVMNGHVVFSSPGISCRIVSRQVFAGSANELESQQGMAHLVEHVAYMGSRKRCLRMPRSDTTHFFLLQLSCTCVIASRNYLAVFSCVRHFFLHGLDCCCCSSNVYCNSSHFEVFSMHMIYRYTCFVIHRRLNHRDRFSLFVCVCLFLPGNACSERDHRQTPTRTSTTRCSTRPARY